MKPDKRRVGLLTGSTRLVRRWRRSGRVSRQHKRNAEKHNEALRRRSSSEQVDVKAYEGIDLTIVGMMIPLIR